MLPRLLSNIKEMPLDKLMTDLDSLSQTFPTTHQPKYIFLLVVLIGIPVLAGLVLGIYKAKEWTTQRREGGETTVGTSSYEIVSAETEGVEFANRSDASAPLRTGDQCSRRQQE